MRWAAPDQPAREEALRTHQIILRLPDGERVGEEWLYGDQVAVKGRVLRLNPLLNSVGIPNLFELQFLHNGYLNAERHSTQPHQARPLKPLGSLAVVPRTAAPARCLLGLAAGPSQRQPLRHPRRDQRIDLLPLVDAQGQPLRRSFDLVLTPGGLTAR